MSKWWNPRFKTKKELEASIRNIANNQKIDLPLGDIDRDFMMWVFSHHDNYHEKVGCGVKDIVVRPDSYGNKCFHFIRIDGSSEDISWTRCLNTGDLKRQDFLSALREEVKYQIFDFRKSAESVCAICGEQISGNMHIDHKIPFSELVIRFFGTTIHETTHHGEFNFLADRKLAERWRDFHEEYAFLQPTHAKCNLMKGTS